MDASKKKQKKKATYNKTNVRPVWYSGASLPKNVCGVMMFETQYMKNAADVVTCFLVNPPTFDEITDMTTV